MPHGRVGVQRTLKNGLDISVAMTLGLISLLPGTDTMDWGIDPSIRLPLLRGAGEHIVTEPLTQAERNVIYEMWDFERYKRTFAVDIATRLLQRSAPDGLAGEQQEQLSQRHPVGPMVPPAGGRRDASRRSRWTRPSSAS